MNKLLWIKSNKFRIILIVAMMLLLGLFIHKMWPYFKVVKTISKIFHLKQPDIDFLPNKSQKITSQACGGYSFTILHNWEHIKSLQTGDVMEVHTFKEIDTKNYLTCFIKRIDDQQELSEQLNITGNKDSLKPNQHYEIKPIIIEDKKLNMHIFREVPNRIKYTVIVNKENLIMTIFINTTDTEKNYFSTFETIASSFMNYESSKEF